IVAIPWDIAACGSPRVTGSPSQLIVPSSGWCAPASTLINVDFPAPFWPSRQCTSPARTSRSTPSSARTPGNSLTMSVIVSSTPPSASVMRHHRVGDHPGGADDARLRAHLGQDDGEVACREGERPPVDDTADLGEQGVAETGRHLAAEDDHRG